MNRFASAVALAPLLLFPALTNFAQPATAVESTLPKANKSRFAKQAVFDQT